jgi:hypothetical protein
MVIAKIKFSRQSSRHVANHEKFNEIDKKNSVFAKIIQVFSFPRTSSNPVRMRKFSRHSTDHFRFRENNLIVTFRHKFKFSKKISQILRENMSFAYVLLTVFTYFFLNLNI